MTATRTPSSLTLNCRSAAGCQTAKPFIILVLHSVVADDRSLAHLNFRSPSIRHERIYEFLSFIESIKSSNIQPPVLTFDGDVSPFVRSNSSSQNCVTADLFSYFFDLRHRQEISDGSRLTFGRFQHGDCPRLRASPLAAPDLGPINRTSRRIRSGPARAASLSA
jgi:hypothetical protein